MSRNGTGHTTRAPLRVVLGVLLCAAALPLCASAPPSSLSAGSGSRLSPSLATLAHTHPTLVTLVIMQDTAPQASVERAVTALGGHVLGAAPRLHLYEATLPAGALPTMARSRGVGQVTLNASMVADDHGNTPDCDCASDYGDATGAAHARQDGHVTGAGIGVAVVELRALTRGCPSWPATWPRSRWIRPTWRPAAHPGYPPAIRMATARSSPASSPERATARATTWASPRAPPWLMSTSATHRAAPPSSM